MTYRSKGVLDSYLTPSHTFRTPFDSMKQSDIFLIPSDNFLTPYDTFLTPLDTYLTLNNIFPIVLVIHQMKQQKYLQEQIL